MVQVSEYFGVFRYLQRAGIAVLYGTIAYYSHQLTAPAIHREAAGRGAFHGFVAEVATDKMNFKHRRT